MALLAVKELSKHYGQHTALKKVSLEIKEGSIYGLLGPNGAGKTSLIRIINQITAPDSGEVFFKGEALKQAHIAHIGYLPEERGLYPKMKVGEQLLYLAQLKGLSKQEAKARLSEWFERMEISGWWDKKIEELSKGMAQKVQFVSTVLHRPTLLIFDEPFTGFDPINTNVIKGEIKRLAQEGATVIFSTHRMESVEELCEEITLINKAQVLLQGKLSALKEQFKQNIYSVELQGAAAPSELQNADILQTKQIGQAQQLRVQVKGNNGNALLRELLQMGEVKHFAEEIPSLNDIFIQKVKENA